MPARGSSFLSEGGASTSQFPWDSLGLPRVNYLVLLSWREVSTANSIALCHAEQHLVTKSLCCDTPRALKLTFPFPSVHVECSMGSCKHLKLSKITGTVIPVQKHPCKLLGKLHWDLFWLRISLFSCHVYLTLCLYSVVSIFVQLLASGYSPTWLFTLQACPLGGKKLLFFLFKSSAWFCKRADYLLL